MNEASLLINSLQARSILIDTAIDGTVTFSFGKYQHCENDHVSFISFNYFETLQVVVISQSLQCQGTQTKPLVIADLFHTFAFTY